MTVSYWSVNLFTTALVFLSCDKIKEGIPIAMVGYQMAVCSKLVSSTLLDVIKETYHFFKATLTKIHPFKINGHR